MISIIVAVAENGVIGNNNALLWHIREDLLHFKALTTGHPIVMGRKTYESLGRPLPNRINVVITRQELAIPGCTVVHSLDEALALFSPGEEVFIIGGAQIYAEALLLADRFYLTRVEHPYEGDTRFPGWPLFDKPDAAPTSSASRPSGKNGGYFHPAHWRLVTIESFPCGADYPYPFTFETYERK